MALAKITLIGMSRWFAMSGTSLFENIILPTGIDKETLVDQIILRGGEFEVLYGDADFYKQAVEAWFRSHNRTFQKWYDALQIEYNPLENYDRKEEWVDTSEGSSNDKSTGHGEGSDKNQISAYDSDVLRDNTKDISTNDTSSSGETHMSNENTRTGRAHGNIGVTTSQQMLQSELDIAKWNLYEQIAELFCDDLTIMIY